MRDTSNLTREEAQQILRCLRDGVPSPEHVMKYSDPQMLLEPPLTGIQAHLEDVARDGATIVRFLSGEYGAGKTHTLDITKELALQKNFLLSSFALEPRGVTFAYTERILAKLINTLAVDGKRSADASETVLQHVLTAWAKTDATEDVAQLVPEMATHPDLRSVLNRWAAILREPGKTRGDSQEHNSLANQWFQPGPTGLAAGERRRIGARRNLSAENALQTVELLAQFFRGIRHAGWVVLVDEQEIIPTLMTTRNRDLSNRTLRVLIDSTGKPCGLYWLLATSPEFFTDRECGISAYPALKGRAQEVLLLPPISASRMKNVGDRLVGICEIAFPDAGVRSRLTQELINGMASLIEADYPALGSRARGFVQSVVRLVDRLRENPQADLQQEMPKVVRDVFGEIEDQIQGAFRQPGA